MQDIIAFRNTCCHNLPIYLLILIDHAAYRSKFTIACTNINLFINQYVCLHISRDFSVALVLPCFMSRCFMIY